MKSVLIALSFFFALSSAHAVSTKNCPDSLYVAVDGLSMDKEVAEMMASLSLEEVFGQYDSVSPVRMSQIVYASHVAKMRPIGALLEIKRRKSGVCHYVDQLGERNGRPNYFARIHGNSRSPKISVQYRQYFDHGFGRASFYYKIKIKTLKKDQIDAVDVDSVKIKTESSDVEWGTSRLGEAQTVILRYQKRMDD